VIAKPRRRGRKMRLRKRARRSGPALKKRKKRALRRRARRVRPSGAEAAAYQRGYADGVRNGAEELLEQLMPPDVLIPDLTPETAMRAGIAALRPTGYPLLMPQAVFHELDAALREQRPYSFIRLGDGELLTLAQERVLPWDLIRTAGAFLPMAGVTVPDLAARDALVFALRNASLVGIPVSRKPFFQPLFVQIVRTYGIPLESLKLTTSTMNYSLDDHGLMMKLMEGRSVLVIGNVAPQLAAFLRSRGVTVTGVIAPVQGFRDAERVIALAAGLPFDLALVAAGIAAVPICVRLAALTGKVAVDFGSLANRLTGVPTFVALPPKPR